MTDKIINAEQSRQIFSEHKTALVTGVFDLLHNGHTWMLNHVSQKLARLDSEYKLVVVILGDEIVRQRKGSNRPIKILKDRVSELGKLGAVDYILPWETDWKGLRDFVLDVEPDMLVAVEGDSGVDNKRKYIEKAGGKLLLLPRLEGYSTTKIVDKLNQSKN
ncbi:MAG: adenylyltransferase/cytidyltransferase family protein [Candidatus Dojkabacteria bacterium]